jgi:N-dimethylarginine dimethylaminohydrolase
MTNSKTYGAQNMFGQIESVLVRRPDHHFGGADPERWHYTGQPDLALAVSQHNAFTKLIQSEIGAEVVFHETPLEDHADAIYVHDPLLICDSGAILLRMGKPLRRGESTAFNSTLAALDIPVHFRLEAPATAEGGDLLWLDERTLAVGQGFRTNAAALEQLTAALPGVELIPVQLPYDQGEAACLHLMSFISIIAARTAVVYLPLMPVPFYQWLLANDFNLIQVPAAEYWTMAPNVLALSPEKCLMLSGNPVTQARITAAGFKVLTYEGSEISLRAEGGPTCLTRPILRS